MKLPTNLRLDPSGTLGKLVTTLQDLLSRAFDQINRLTAKSDNRLDVKADYGATGNGTTSDQSAVAAAVAAAYAAGDWLYWPDGTYLTTATIPNLHDVRHVGPGVIKRGSDLFYVQPRGSQANSLYLAPTGSNSNDGLSSSQPRLTFQSVFDALANYGPVLDGNWSVIGAAGTITISGGEHTHSTPSKNRVVVRGPAQGHPNVPTLLVDGGGNQADYNHGLNFDGIGVRVEVRDIKFQNFTEASGNTRIGLLGANGADIYTVNVHAADCSWTSIMCKETEQARISGGILDAGSAGAYCFVSDSSHTSFGYGAASTSDGPTVKNAISAGVYWSTGSQGHCDYANIQDCGVGFLVAENSRCDTVGDDFKRNTVAIRAQTGGKFSSGGAALVFNNGGADANTTNIEYRAYSGDLSEMDDVGAGSWMRIAYDRTNRALSGVTPTTLTTPYTIPAYRLQGVGKSCRVCSYGTFTQATAGSTVTVNFGGLALTLTIPGAATNLTFVLEAEMHEVAGGYRAFGTLRQGLNLVRVGNATATFDKTASQAVSIAATLANAGDSMNIYRTDVFLIG